MAKKYLLYIHNDSRFDAEREKSRLVNRLLNDYWQEEDARSSPALKGCSHLVAEEGKCIICGEYIG